MKFRFTLAALLLPALAGAISPEPQKMHTTDGSAFCARKAVYKLTGADEADPDAVNALRANLKTDGTPTVEIIIGERGDDAVKNVAEKIPEVAEGYYLNIVSPNRVIIAGADEVGTFYGVQTFLRFEYTYFGTNLKNVFLFHNEYSVKNQHKL